MGEEVIGGVGEMVEVGGRGGAEGGLDGAEGGLTLCNPGWQVSLHRSWLMEEVGAGREQVVNLLHPLRKLGIDHLVGEGCGEGVQRRGGA